MSHDALNVGSRSNIFKGERLRREGAFVPPQGAFPSQGKRHRYLFPRLMLSSLKRGGLPNWPLQLHLVQNARSVRNVNESLITRFNNSNTQTSPAGMNKRSFSPSAGGDAATWSIDTHPACTAGPQGLVEELGTLPKGRLRRGFSFAQPAYSVRPPFVAIVATRWSLGTDAGSVWVFLVGGQPARQ